MQLVDDAGAQLSVGGPIVRLLLTQLVLAEGRTVTDEEAIDAVWGEFPPDTVDTALRVHAGHVRRTVATLGGRIVRRHHGYALVDADVRTDLERLSRFESTALGTSPGALNAAVEALSLWRGQSLVDVRRLPLGGRLAVNVDRRREDLLDRQMALLIGQGSAEEVVAQAEHLLAAGPLNERRWILLATAHHHRGEPALALLALDRASEALEAGLGMPPSQELRQLRRRIVTDTMPVARHRGPSVDIAVGVPTELEALAPPRLYGRTEALGALTKAMAGTLERGVSRLIRVIGEAGIGKSALIAQAALAADQRGLRVLHGYADQGATGPLGLFTAPLRGLFAQTASDPEVRAARRTLQDFLAGEIGGSELTSSLDPMSDRARLLDAVRRLLDVVSRRRGLLLVLDDVQWADELSRLVVNSLHRHPVAGPVLVLCAHRPTTDSLGLVGAEELILAPLSREHLALWVGDERSTSLHRLTGGLPLLVDTALRHLPAGVGAEALPPTVGRDLLQERTADLPERTRELLAQGAVIGARFGVDELVAIADGDVDVAQLVDSLDAAVTAELVHYDASRSGGFRFAHEMLRLAARSQVPASTAMRWHAKLFAVAAPTAALTALHHARFAGRLVPPANLARTTVRAAQELLTARSFATAATELTGTLAAAEAVDHSTRAAMLTLLARAEVALGQAREAKRHLSEALAEAQEGDDPAVLGTTVAAQSLFGWSFSTHVDVSSVMAGVLDRLPAQASQSRFDLLRHVTYCCILGGRLESAVEPLLAVQRMAVRLDTPEALAQAASLRHLYADDSGRPHQRREAGAALDRLSRAHDHPEVQARRRLVGMIDAVHDGDPVRLLDLVETLAADCVVNGDPYREWIALAGAFTAYLVQGRLEEASAAAERAAVRGSQSAIIGAAGVHSAQQFTLGWILGRLPQTIAEPEGDELEAGRLAWSGAQSVACLLNGDRAAAAACVPTADELTSYGQHWIGFVGLALTAETAALLVRPDLLAACEPILARRVDGHVMLGTGAVDLGPASRYLALCEYGLGREHDGLVRLSEVAADPTSGSLWQLRARHDLARLTGTTPPDGPLWSWLHRLGTTTAPLHPFYTPPTP